MVGIDFPSVWRGTPEPEETEELDTETEEEVAVVKGRVITCPDYRR